MIIESAFYRLPELWMNARAPANERDLVTNLKQLIEEHAKQGDIDLTTSFDYPYDINKTNETGPKLSADLHTHWSHAGPSGSLSRQYVIQENVWLEAKYYRANKTHRLTLPRGKTKEIKRDLIRLCTLVQEHRGSIRDSARYFCAVFYGTPDQAHEQTMQPCEITEPWLQQLLSPGLTQKVQVIYSDLGGLTTCINLTLDKITYVFAPPPKADQHSQCYWGYLIRICSFSANLTDAASDVVSMSYEEPNGHWSQQCADAQQQIGSVVVKGL